MKKFASRALLALALTGCAFTALSSAPTKQETQVWLPYVARPV